MRTLEAWELDAVGGGAAGPFNGECNVKLAEHLLSVAGLFSVSGPVGYAIAVVGWALTARSAHQCVDDYYTPKYQTLVTPSACIMVPAA